MPQSVNDKSAASAEHRQFESVLKGMLSAMAGQLGERFLTSLVKELCEFLVLDSAFIAHRTNTKNIALETLAVFHEERDVENFSIKIKDNASEAAFKSGSICIENDVQNQFPNDTLLRRWSIQGFIGVELKNSSNEVIGLLCGMSKQPIAHPQLALSVLQLFSFRVAAELERQQVSQNLEQEVMVNQAQLDSVPALMFMLNEEGKFLRWNRYFRSKFGYSRHRMENETVFSAIHESDQKRLTLELSNIFRQGFGTMYLNGVTHSGEMVPLLATAQATEYEGQKVIVGVALDMTEQQTVERNLLRSQGRLARKNSQLSLINTLVDKLHTNHSVIHIAQEIVSLLSNIHDDAVVIFCAVDQTAENLEIIASRGTTLETLNARKKFPILAKGSPTGLAMSNRKLEVFRDLASDDRLDPSIQTLINNERIKSGIVVPLFYSDKPLGGITIGLRYSSEFPEDELDFYRTISASVSLALSNAQQFEMLEKLATHDTLTHLPNRNALNNDCQQAIENSKKNDQLFGLILIDLDRFKEINDTLDHQIGDSVLKLVGPRIIAALEDEQVKVYRLGGDEFGVLVENFDGDDDIEAIAAKISLVIAKPFMVDGLNLEISSSIGIVVSLSEQRNANEMLRCVELAMYEAKNQGGGIYRYTPDLDANTNQRFVIMAEMAEAIRQNELILHFQPKFDLTTRRIIGCEALVRWQHKDYGLLPPAKFIPLVELTQLIHPLTFWVMDSAMAQMQQWKQQGIVLTIAINLSTRNLTDPEFINQVDELMRRYQIRPEELEFEVTETALMGNLEAARQQLARLHKRGITSSLDDYGTGYSSLSYIKNLPLDILKIDRSFISKLTENSEDKIIAQSTINLAHSLGMKVVAEGVETESTLHELARQGCDFIQGYFISEPLDAESFAKLYWSHD